MHSQPRQSSFHAAGCLIAGIVLGFAVRSGIKTRLPVAEREQAPAAASPDAASEASVQKAKHFPDALLRLRQLSTGRADLNEGIALIQELTAAECQGAIELFRHWPKEERQTIELLLARRWAKLDPESILTLKKDRAEASSMNFFLMKPVARSPSVIPSAHSIDYQKSPIEGSDIFSPEGFWER